MIKSREQPLPDINKSKGNVRPTTRPVQAAERITGVGYSLDCQIIITTTVRKNTFRKMDRCTEPLTYKISPDGQYLVYLEKYIYSLNNNADTILDIPSLITDYYIDKNNNLSFLGDQTLVYYFIPQLFQSYPDINLTKSKVMMSLPNLGKKYAKISEDSDNIILSDTQGAIIYTISFRDLSEQLLPAKNSGINREKLNWTKRIFYIDNYVFKTSDPNGDNAIIHPLKCDGKTVVPVYNMFARSPDGTLLAFLVPSGEIKNIVLYDLVKDECQSTGLSQTTNYRENFAFSPDGSYLVYVNDGINLYLIGKKSDYQLVAHTAKSYSSASAVTGPIVWSGDSKFIFAAVTQITNGALSSTSLVRVYFNEFYRGEEQSVLNIPAGSLYAVSPDGNKILYTKDKNIYMYDVEKASNSFYQNVSGQNNLNKIVWLRNDKIITSQRGDGLYIIDFDGENYVYNVNDIIKIYDLINERDKTAGNIIKGKVLSLFY